MDPQRRKRVAGENPSYKFCTGCNFLHGIPFREARLAHLDPEKQQQEKAKWDPPTQTEFQDSQELKS
jgi:hypothetical protein